MPDERKTVSALFADVVGSAAMGSQRDPKLVRDVRRQLFARTKSIGVPRGTVERTPDAAAVLAETPA